MEREKEREKAREGEREREKARLNSDKVARNVSLVGGSYVCMYISIGPVLRISSTQDRATESLAQQRLESAPLCLQASKGYVKTLRRVDSMVIVSKTPCCSRERFSDGVVVSYSNRTDMCTHRQSQRALCSR